MAADDQEPEEEPAVWAAWESQCRDPWGRSRAVSAPDVYRRLRPLGPLLIVFIPLSWGLTMPLINPEHPVALRVALWWFCVTAPVILPVIVECHLLRSGGMPPLHDRWLEEVRLEWNEETRLRRHGRRPKK